MTAETEMPASALVPESRMTPSSAAEYAFDPGETCARCGPSTQAHVKWLFPPVSEFTHAHVDLYLCTHCSSVNEARLRTTSILTVDSTKNPR